jgi:ankyrin repeat protein
VHNLTYLGMKDRLGELFAADPTLVNVRHLKLGFTPLFALPANDDDAIDMASFLLSHGADPTIVNGDGLTAEDVFRKDERMDIAEFLHDAVLGVRF